MPLFAPGSPVIVHERHEMAERADNFNLQIPAQQDTNGYCYWVMMPAARAMGAH
jgi:hypothetical protein